LTDIEHLVKLYNRKRYTKLIRDGLPYIIVHNEQLPQGWGLFYPTRLHAARLLLFEGLIYGVGRVHLSIDIDYIVHRILWGTATPPKIIHETSCHLNEWRIEGMSPSQIQLIGQRVGNLIYLLLPKEMISVTRILSCENSAIQSNLIAKYGEKEFFSKLNAPIIHQDGDSQLLRVTINRIEMMMVKVVDATTKQTYLLRVPPRVPVLDNKGREIPRRIRSIRDPPRVPGVQPEPITVPMKTCRQAIAWTFNMKENEYHPEKEA